MRVLVVGGSGFIGSHVVDKLIGKGVNVRIFDGIMPTFRKDVDYYQGNILDTTALSFAMTDMDAVMHLAAVADVRDVFENPHHSEAINVRGTINVLETARKSGVKRVIFGSTIWVYSETNINEVDESTPLSAPSHLYTATKLSGEYYCHAYSKLYGLEVTILRYGIPYGPRARDGAVIPIFVRNALNGKPITITGDGLQFRRFIYVEDLAEGNALALQSIAKNKIYNLDGKEKITIRRMAETIQKIIRNVKIEYVADRPGDFSGKEVSSDRAKIELGWKPVVSFEEGLRRYIDWYLEREKKRKEEWDKLDKIFKRHDNL